MPNENWQPVFVTSNTIYHALNNIFVEIQNKYDNSFPKLRSSPVLLLGSDYSGDLPEAPYMVYSFLITTFESWVNWEPLRLKIREQIFSDARRMSFKGLNDVERKRALYPLLSAANDLNGLLFTVGINKQCNKKLFSGYAPLDLKNPDLEHFKKWKRPVLEKAFIVLHFWGFLIAGLSQEGQNIFWFTDEDDIAANDERMCELTNLFAWVSNEYLNHSLGDLRCGTSRCDDGSKEIEDFLAIPDLIAGAISEQLIISNKNNISDFLIYCGEFSEKTKIITQWFSNCNYSLKRFFCLIDPIQDDNSLNVKLVHFHNQN